MGMAGTFPRNRTRVSARAEEATIFACMLQLIEQWKDWVTIILVTRNFVSQKFDSQPTSWHLNFVRLNLKMVSVFPLLSEINLCHG